MKGEGQSEGCGDLRVAFRKAASVAIAENGGGRKPGGVSDMLEQQYTCEQMIGNFKNMGVKIINGLKSNIGYQK